MNDAVVPMMLLDQSDRCCAPNVRRKRINIHGFFLQLKDEGDHASNPLASLMDVWRERCCSQTFEDVRQLLGEGGSLSRRHRTGKGQRREAALDSTTEQAPRGRQGRNEVTEPGRTLDLRSGWSRISPQGAGLIRCRQAVEGLVEPCPLFASKHTAI